MVNQLRVERTLAAPPATVWRALTEADAITAWFWPPNLSPRVATDPRPGGRYRIEATGLAVSGQYASTQPPDQLEFTWQWDGDANVSTVRIELSAVDDGTALELTHDGLVDAADRDNHIVGWTDCLDRLPGYLDHG